MLLSKNIKFEDAAWLACLELLKYDDLSQIDYDDIVCNIIGWLSITHGKREKYYYKSFSKIERNEKKMDALSKAIMACSTNVDIDHANLCAIKYIVRHKEEPWLFEDYELCAKYALYEATRGSSLPKDYFLNR